MFSSDPSEYEEMSIIAPSRTLLEPKLKSSNPSHILNIALADHNYCAPLCTESDLADDRYNKLEPGDIDIELEVNDNVVVGTSEFRHPRIKHEGLSKKISKHAINRNQKIGNAAPKKTLAGPLCWKRRQPKKREVQTAVLSKNSLARSHHQKNRRQVKRKTNKLLLQCKVKVLDVRDTLYCHECGEWCLIANDLLCHTLMTHDVHERTSEPFQTENQEIYPEKYNTEIQNNNKQVSQEFETENHMCPSEQFETENQNICPEKSKTENKSKTTKSIEPNKIFIFKEEYLDEDLYDNIFQCENENLQMLYPCDNSETETQKTENKSKTTKSIEPNKIFIFKEEYLDEDLYDNIFQCENENLQMLYPYDNSETETQKVNTVTITTKSQCSNKSKTKKPDMLNKKMPRDLKSQKVNHNDKTIKNKATPKSIDQIFPSDLKFAMESQNHYKIKRTKSDGPNILILPCKTEPQTEHQNANKFKSTKSKGPNKHPSKNQQIYPEESKTENKNYESQKIKSERLKEKDKKLNKTNQPELLIIRKQKLEIEQLSNNDNQLLVCKVEIPDVKDTLYCQECGEWSVTAENLLYHTLMKHSIYDDMYQSEINQFQEENQKTDRLSIDYIESQKENQNINTVKSTKSKEIKQKGKGELKKRKPLKKQEPNKVFPCDLCDKSFTRQCNLDLHKHAHEKKPFSCEICGHMFDSEEKCVTHEKSHLGIKKFACDVCDKTFDAKTYLEMHKNSHTGAKPYTCDACENTFTWKSNLQKHFQICSEYNNGKIPPKRYKCEKCDYKTYVKSQVKQHCINVHGTDVFVCDTCGRKCNTKAKMERHVLVHATIKPFKCKLCEFRFVTEKKLKNHIEACHLATKKYTCKVCKKGFKTLTCVKRHEKIHSGIRPHTCQICNRSFVLKTTLICHIRTHSTDKPFSCAMCGSKFKTRIALTSHQEIHKENRPVYVCAHCGDVLLFKSSLLRHLKSCLVLQGLPKKTIKRTSSKPTYCEQCNKTFTYNHYVTEHKDAHKGFSCAICNMKFKNKQRCEIHELKHAGLHAHACHLCNKRFSDKKVLSDHMHKHMKIKPYTCNLCPQTFAYRSNVYAHKKMFHSKIEIIRSHECDMCHKKYFRKNHLIRHKKTHNKGRPCRCKKCGKRYPDESQLRLHVKTHNNIKPYSCNACEKSFKSKSSMKDHIFFTHEKYTIKLSCDICNRVLRNKTSLKSHKDKHKNLKIFSCDVCDKSFYTRQYLNRHKIVHDENFTFSCSECEVTFKEKFNLVKHLMSHTDKPHICEVCEEPFKTQRLLQYHEEIHEAVKQLYECQYCSKTYESKDSKRRHEKNSCLKALKIRKKRR